MRTYRSYTWKQLLSIRDSLQVLYDTLDKFTEEWDFIDDVLAEVSEEVDFRYKHNLKEG